jgi:hypothetical protein
MNIRFYKIAILHAGGRWKAITDMLSHGTGFLLQYLLQKVSRDTLT